MADKTHVNFDKVGNYVRNKAYPEKILWDIEGKISDFQKSCQKFLLYMDTGLTTVYCVFAVNCNGAICCIEL